MKDDLNAGKSDVIDELKRRLEAMAKQQSKPSSSLAESRHEEDCCPPPQTSAPREKKRTGSCRDRALKLLGMRDHAEAELRRKLLQAGHESQEVDDAVSYLKSLGYLNDDRFARTYAKSLMASGKYGRAMILQKLFQHGIRRSVATEALDEVWHQDSDEVRARQLVRRKASLETLKSDPKQRAKVARFLAGRGFSMAVIQKVLRLDWSEEDLSEG